MKISGYVPFYNNATTVLAAVESLRQQQPPLDEVFAVDDGSTDDGAMKLERAGVKVFRQAQNLGRGAARARAMVEAQYEGVVCCDATNLLPVDFTARAKRWLEEPRVAGAFGRLAQAAGGNAATRWRGRYLFRLPKPGTPLPPINRHGCLSTYGALVRRSAVMEVGNYDARLRHSEDAELGGRLLAKGWDVVQDPSLEAIAGTRNSLSQVMERYWRWNAGTNETISWSGYVKLLSYSAKVMAADDLREGDFGRAMISLYCPHYQFWRSWWRQRRNRVQR